MSKMTSAKTKQKNATNKKYARKMYCLQRVGSREEIREPHLRLFVEQIEKNPRSFGQSVLSF
jgi:hypothetical protein